MLDKIKQVFGLDKPNSEGVSENDSQPTQAKSTEPENIPLTQDEYAQQIIRRLREDAEAEAKRYREEIEKLAQPLPRVNDVPQQPSDISGEEKEDLSLPENPTVEDLLNYVNQMVEQKVEQRLRQIMASLPKVPVSSFVDSVVSRHPSLRSVAEEAKQIMETLPKEYQNEQTADFILWWLKGKRSEAEKKEALSELLGVSPTHSQSVEQPTIPYTAEQIREWAEAMGIDPKRFRQRLIEYVNK